MSGSQIRRLPDKKEFNEFASLTPTFPLLYHQITMKQFLLLVVLSSVASAAPFTPATALRYEPTPQELLENCRSAKKRAESAL